MQDYGDVVVHVFDPDTRDYYKLEELWADATKVDWEREVLMPHKPAAPTGERFAITNLSAGPPLYPGVGRGRQSLLGRRTASLRRDIVPRSIR